MPQSVLMSLRFLLLGNAADDAIVEWVRCCSTANGDGLFFGDWDLRLRSVLHAIHEDESDESVIQSVPLVNRNVTSET